MAGKAFPSNYGAHERMARTLAWTLAPEICRALITETIRAALYL